MRQGDEGRKQAGDGEEEAVRTPAVESRCAVARSGGDARQRALGDGFAPGRRGAGAGCGARRTARRRRQLVELRRPARSENNRTAPRRRSRRLWLLRVQWGVRLILRVGRLLLSWGLYPHQRSLRWCSWVSLVVSPRA